MTFVWTKIRNYASYFWYGIKIGEINILALLIDFAILIYSIIGLGDMWKIGNIWLLLLLIFINVGWQIFSTLKECISYFSKGKGCYKRTRGNKYKVLLHEELRDEYNIILVEKIKGLVLVSDKANDIIRNKKVLYKKYSKKGERVKKYIRVNKSVLIRFLNWKWREIIHNGGAFYNESKLCMAGELFSKKEDEDTYVLPVCKGSYYNSFLTNNIYSIGLYENSFCIEAPMNIRNYEIRSLHDSDMGDHIGVSTLAISRDGYAFIMRHNNKTAVSNDKLQPTGSGSVDFQDLEGGDSNFTTVICKAAIRELKEETFLPESVIDRTVIVGFYRDLGRAGKPEYCCLSFLNKDAIDIYEMMHPCKKEQSEEIQKVRVREECGGINIEQINKYLKDKIDEMSLSLYMTYYMGIQYFNEIPIYYKSYTYLEYVETIK